MGRPAGRLVGGCWGSGAGAWHQPTRISQFSLMQFSNTFRVHFTFKDFAHSSDPVGSLGSVYQLRGFTHTATAIHIVT